MDKLIKALSLAAHAHRNQKRRISKAPYFVHILDVLKNLQFVNASEDVLIAGVLHDILEDTTEGINAIKPFGQEVVKIVIACSEKGNNPDSTDAEMKDSWFERKKNSLKKAPLASDDELLVMLADKLANLQSMYDDISAGFEIWDEFNADKKDLAWYYHSFWLIFAKRFSDDNRLVKLYWRALQNVFAPFVNYWSWNNHPIATIWRDGINLENFSPYNQVSGICCTKDGKVLIIKDNKEENWIIPGGTLEINETFEETLIREVDEEASVKVGVCVPFGASEVFFRNNPTKERFEHFFQLRCIALIEDILDPSPDPDSGVIRTRKFINIDEFNDYVKWGCVSKEMIIAAQKSLKKL